MKNTPFGARVSPGGVKMIGAAMFTTIKTLWERHKNKTMVAGLTGHDWKTVDKIVKLIESGGKYPERKPHPRILDPYREKILEWLEKDGLNGLKTFERLRSEGMKIGYTTVKTYLADIKKRDEIFMRIETLPGEEAQVDFGYVGLTLDNNGKKRKTWIFNMRLSCSRLDYYQKAYDQRVETFIECHINAFKYFGGVPEYVRIDNLKAAILEANFYEPIYQGLYSNFASHYGFKSIPCRVRRPNDKGKVESGIKYVKCNFFLGRTFTSGDDLDNQLRHWLDNTCNQRMHGTIRKIPKEVFESEEKSKLRPLPIEEFRMSTVGSRKVYHDCHVFIDYSYYSVPFEYVGKEVDIDMTKELVRIFYQGREIAVHPHASERGKFQTNVNHYPKYKRFSDTEYQERYQAKMADIGPYTEQIFFMIIEKHPRDWSRTVQGILSLVKSYPKAIIDLACKRAIAFRVYHYRVIRNICHNGSYNLPIEFNVEEINEYEYAKV
ncbi:IS21 family transposase [Patescibacteria group bacterium]|nr:IS21 family transposase [Patescibacteria group bacterium]